ncbi:hypothetical protein ON010_g4607 [Phytophthora cinnamomi]|nr:hypothetical protein ON010_g4607 [Phytophthora cinnamomi]
MMQAESDAIILTGEMQYVKSCLLKVLALVEKNKPAFSSLDPANEAKRVNKSGSFTDVSSKMKRAFSGLGRTSARKAPTLPEVVHLHRRVRIAQLELRRCDQAFLELCINVDVLQDRSAQRGLPAGSLYPETSALNRLHNLFLDTRHHARRWVTSPVVIACAVVTGFLSLGGRGDEQQSTQRDGACICPTARVSCVMLLHEFLYFATTGKIRATSSWQFDGAVPAQDINPPVSTAVRIGAEYSTPTAWRRSRRGHSFQCAVGKHARCSRLWEGIRCLRTSRDDRVGRFHAD